MKYLSYLILLCIPAVFIACTKDAEDDLIHITCNPSSDGSFAATINNQSWTACQFKTVYYPKVKLLVVKAVDNSYQHELRIYIRLDSITPLKTYTINSTSTSGFEIIESTGSGNVHSTDIYYCDSPKPGQGGTFALSKLDTVSGTMSATFTITGYSQDQAKNIVLTNGAITNAKLITSSLSYDTRSYVSATINGVNWYSDYIWARITGYIVPLPQYSYLGVRATGYTIDLGDCPSYNQSYASDFKRNFYFDIPLAKPVGTYALETANQFYSDREHFLLSYDHHDFNNRYYPVSGSTITVTNIDTANKRLDINFTTQVKDATGNTFNVTDGKIHLVYWDR